VMRRVTVTGDVATAVDGRTSVDLTVREPAAA